MFLFILIWLALWAVQPISVCYVTLTLMLLLQGTPSRTACVSSTLRKEYAALHAPLAHELICRPLPAVSLHTCRVITILPAGTHAISSHHINLYTPASPVRLSTKSSSLPQWQDFAQHKRKRPSIEQRRSEDGVQIAAVRSQPMLHHGNNHAPAGMLGLPGQASVACSYLLRTANRLTSPRSRPCHCCQRLH